MTSTSPAAYFKITIISDLLELFVKCYISLFASLYFLALRAETTILRVVAYSLLKTICCMESMESSETSSMGDFSY